MYITNPLLHVRICPAYISITAICDTKSRMTPTCNCNFWQKCKMGLLVHAYIYTVFMTTIGYHNLWQKCEMFYFKMSHSSKKRSFCMFTCVWHLITTFYKNFVISDRCLMVVMIYKHGKLNMNHRMCILWFQNATFDKNFL